jgi:hypothetical protein
VNISWPLGERLLGTAIKICEYLNGHACVSHELRDALRNLLVRIFFFLRTQPVTAREARQTARTASQPFSDVPFPWSHPDGYGNIDADGGRVRSLSR